ncbi:MAG: extracellular solute-binding protein [Deltaproteobacteria bacterium]
MRDAKAKAKVIDRRPFLVALLTGGLILLGATLAVAQDQKTITSYGYSTFGTLKYPQDIKHLDYVNPDAPKGGEISVWFPGTFDTFNPYTAKGQPAYLANIAYESILTSTLDEVNSLYCYLCETLEYPEDESWVIFHLRHDVTFSDGTPLTAQDVVYSHYKLLDEGLPSYAETVKLLIPKAEALDDYTVKFTFGADVPKKDLIGQAGGTPVWSKAWMEANDYKLSESSLKMPIGSAPYMLDSYDINQRIVYKRNPNFWGANQPFNIGQNNFDTIRVEYFADSDAAFEGFKAGAYTFREENSSIVWATRYDFPALSKGWVIKTELDSGVMPPATGFITNLRREKFQDRRVRQALALMFNFDWTNKTLQYGLFDQRQSFWQGMDMEAKGKPEGEELAFLESVKDMIDPSILTDDVALAHVSDADRQLDRKNLRKALALMEDAGWTTGTDGLLRNAEGKTFDVELLEDNPGFDRVLLPYVENLKQLGVNVNYNRIDPAQYGERQRTFDYDMIYGVYSNAMEESIGIEQRYGTEGLGDIFNPSGYASPAVDKLIKDVVTSKSRDSMAAGVRAIDRILRHEQFLTPAWYKANYWLAYYDMYEHPATLPQYGLGQLSIWWYNAEKAEKLKAEGALK